MDLLKKTKELCRIYNIQPARSRGQNFLIKEDVYDKIIAAADLTKDDIVLEVGPGLGFLTAKLAKNVKKVIAVELDDRLAEILKTALMAQGTRPVKSLDSSQGAQGAFNRVNNVEVVNENILDLKIEPPLIPPYQGGVDRKYKIVANLPYNITSVFLRKFLSADVKPELMVLMLQKEVAERICALPSEIRSASRPSGISRGEPSEIRSASRQSGISRGEPSEIRSASRPSGISRGEPGKMSLLSVSVQFYAEPEIIKYVSAENFWPQPEVDSAIVKIKIKSSRPLLQFGGQAFVKGGKNEKDFFRLVKIGFSARRKMLKNNLANGLHLTQKEVEEKLKSMGFNEKIRAQELAVSDWLKLFELFNKNMV